MFEPIVIEFFELIVSNVEDDELAALNYFERTYIDPGSKRLQPQYSLEFWNIFCLKEIPNSDDGKV